MQKQRSTLCVTDGIKELYTYTKISLFQTEVVLDVLNIILTDQNQDGFSSLSDVTQEVLHSAEKYNQYIGLAMVNDSKTNDHQMLYSGENIGNTIS